MPQNQQHQNTNLNQSKNQNQQHRNQNQGQGQNPTDPRREERDNRQQNLATTPPNATRAASVPRDNDLAKPSEEWNRAENTGQIQENGAQDEAMQDDDPRDALEEGSPSERTAP